MAGQSAPATGGPGREEVLQRLEALQCSADVFSCEAMVAAVNGLRHLGKDAALQCVYQPATTDGRQAVAI